MAAADPNKEELYVSVPMEFEARATKISLGYCVATADLPHDRKLSIVATGRYVTITVSGSSGRVELDLQSAIEKAALLLTEPEPPTGDPTYVCASCAHQWRSPEAPARCENCHTRGFGNVYEFPPTSEGDDAAEEFSRQTLDAIGGCHVPPKSATFTDPHGNGHRDPLLKGGQ